MISAPSQLLTGAGGGEGQCCLDGRDFAGEKERRLGSVGSGRSRRGGREVHWQVILEGWKGKARETRTRARGRSWAGSDRGNWRDFNVAPGVAHVCTAKSNAAAFVRGKWET
eukprot:2508109-Rhodomonas_salina.1